MRYINVHQKSPEQCRNTSNPTIVKKDKEHIEFIRRMPSWFNFKKAINSSYYLKRIITEFLKKTQRKKNQTKTTCSPETERHVLNWIKVCFWNKHGI